MLKELNNFSRAGIHLPIASRMSLITAIHYETPSIEQKEKEFRVHRNIMESKICLYSQA
jgi:hypothetical protein